MSTRKGSSWTLPSATATIVALLALGLTACSASDDSDTASIASATPAASTSSAVVPKAPAEATASATTSPSTPTERTVCTADPTSWRPIGTASDDANNQALASALGPDVTREQVAAGQVGIVTCTGDVKVVPWEHVRVESPDGKEEYGTPCMLANFTAKDTSYSAICAKPQS